MSNLPKNYKPVLGVKETEHAIVSIKDFFQLTLSTELNLTRVTAPLFVPSGMGINDDLNGVEKPVSFNVKGMNGQKMEIVQSLAKWKRLKVTEMGMKPGFGIYTDMNAIRPDEELDAVHSLYVDQWDWCMAIDEKDRTVFYLFDIVKKIYRTLKRVEFFLYDRYSMLEPVLPEDIKLIYSDDLLREYPGMTAKERENAAAKKYGAVFICGIGGKLPDGSIHDGRAPDYDDWITDAGDGHVGLNGDIIVWNETLGRAFELSSMGIRVSPESLKRQLKERGCEERAELPFQKKLLNGELSFTLGGGIGQSRLCMFLLRKAHICEVQVSEWPQSELDACAAAGIPVL
ncbi:MAG: aspartate--ammonia ligase [Treponema sp.]|nr:aspartate--ammonia ligase [Treponema sp.]MCI6315779.1 aspartate--ammonia ligase [Spirochaetia bacterium]MCI6545710.1 aspartate--ammonia ligase [Spirochaetia bacterium]MCI7436661.1 aspartate--ammonia ligase [Spirochaetia bacterium]MDY2825011.1 aspartate--ammonia ligase [Treponema sp.]